VDRVKEIAYHFGMAFQIRDDILDMKEDARKKNSANIAISIGKERAIEKFHQELGSFKTLLKKFQINTPVFQEIYKRLAKDI